METRVAGEGDSSALFWGSNIGGSFVFKSVNGHMLSEDLYFDSIRRVNEASQCCVRMSHQQTLSLLRRRYRRPSEAACAMNRPNESVAHLSIYMSYTQEYSSKQCIYISREKNHRNEKESPTRLVACNNKNATLIGKKQDNNKRQPKTIKSIYRFVNASL